MKLDSAGVENKLNADWLYISNLCKRRLASPLNVPPVLDITGLEPEVEIFAEWAKAWVFACSPFKDLMNCRQHLSGTQMHYNSCQHSFCFSDSLSCFAFQRSFSTKYSKWDLAVVLMDQKPSWRSSDRLCNGSLFLQQNTTLFKNHFHKSFNMVRSSYVYLLAGYNKYLKSRSFEILLWHDDNTLLY